MDRRISTNYRVTMDRWMTINYRISTDRQISTSYCIPTNNRISTNDWISTYYRSPTNYWVSTNYHISTDRSPQTNESAETDGSPQTIESSETDGSAQTIESPETDGSAQTIESSETDGSAQTIESPETDGSPQTIKSPETDGSPQTIESPETDGSPQTIKSPETDGSPQTIEFPQTDRSPQTMGSPQAIDYPQTIGSPQIIECPQIDRFSQTIKYSWTEGSPQTIESPGTDRSPQTTESPQTDGSPLTIEFSLTDGSLQTIESPQTGGSSQTIVSIQRDRSPQTIGSPQIIDYPQTIGSPQIIECPQIDRSPKTIKYSWTEGSPQTIESRRTEGSPQTIESPQTDRSHQTIESPGRDRSPQTIGSSQTIECTQTDRSPQTIESSWTEGSQQTIESPPIKGSPQNINSLQTNRSLQTIESPQTDRSPQTIESPWTDGSPHTIESQQTDGSPQTIESPGRERSPQAIGSSQTIECPQTDISPQTIKSPETDGSTSSRRDKSPQIIGSPQTVNSLQIIGSPQSIECPQTDRSPQTIKTSWTEGSPQTIESPWTDRSTENINSPQTDRFPQTIESSQIDGYPQSVKSSWTEESPQTIESRQIERSSQNTKAPQSHRSPQTVETPQTDGSFQTLDSPQTIGSPQTIDYSQTTGPTQIIECPQTDRSLQTIETSWAEGSLQTIESPWTDNSSPQTTESPKTDESPQTTESLQTDRSPQTIESPQTDRSQQTIDSPENTRTVSCILNGICETTNGDAESNDSTKRNTKIIARADIGKDQLKQQEKTEEKKKLFKRIHLNRNDQLRAADVLQITKYTLHTFESCAEEELVQTFIVKLLMMDYRARYIQVKETKQMKTDTGSSIHGGDIFKAMSLSTKVTSKSERIHPMDVQMAVFHCADGFLKQMMVTKLSQCQYALPLLVPDPFTQQIEFPLWTFRKINKSWKIRNTNNEIISQTQPIYKAETPMVFFFRFGSVSSSKSHLMNNLINEKHNTFFHRNCAGSSRYRVQMDGVVEIAWFCPSGKDTDKFNNCVAFCNLHGDAGEHEKQMNILMEMASVNVVLLPQLDSNDRSAKTMQNLFTNTKPLICLFTEDESDITEIEKWKFKIGLKYRNQSDVSEELRGAIKDCLLESSGNFRLDAFKHSDIIVDEKDDEDCRNGREAAQLMVSLLEKKKLTEIKELLLPHQGKLWHQWSQKNKELHRPQGDEPDKVISSRKTEMGNIREQQHESDISEFMKRFIKTMDSDAQHEKVFFLKWLTTLLDEHTSDNLSDLHNKYNKTWSKIVELRDQKDNNDKPEQLKAKQAELEKIYEDLQAAAFGLEHIMREISQIYESCSSMKENKKDLPVDFSSLPSIAAEMMISGFPLELMDGDAAHVPVIWISAVLEQLVQKLGDQKVFVLSVLGIQSSGKSTMLNAMFGLQFAVSAGRCTRGAFMQLVKVSDEMKTEINLDYILVVDTEGLRSLELAGKSTRGHDNELATFVVGLGNLTLINIFGENPSEMQDTLQIVVQAFMRMKRVKLNPSCVFVHQNVSDITAGEKNMEGRRKLQETLDEMTKLAAKDEVCYADRFSDVIKFDVQNDIKYFAQLWEGSPPMAPPNPNYCDNVQDLKKSITSHASKSQGIMLRDLKARIKDLWEALLNEQFVFSFRNSLEISAYRKLETEYSKWSWSLRRTMMETENKLHNLIENEKIHEVKETDLQGELKKTSEEVQKSMSEFFEKDKDNYILIQWKTSFEIKIKDVQENIVRETKKKLNEVLQQRDLKKEIDAQRTYHENTLFEKSKELALTLKDKANDEETLKNEFNAFWEKSVKKIITNTPPIKEIDIMRDVRDILNDIYTGFPVDHCCIKNDIFTVQSYSEYVVMKKPGVKTFIKGMLGYGPLSKEDEAKIKTFVTDVAQQTDKQIHLFNISKMGYNISCIQQLTGYIKARVTQHEEGPVKYVFKNEFFIDLVLSIFKRANKTFTEQHKLFREANDPELYVEKKREEYYSIFQKHIHGATSAAIFGEIICQKLKEPIEQSIYKKTARELGDEMRSNCPSLNGNRSNLEKHILKTLAEEEDFGKYMNYIYNPQDHFKSFISDEVSQYITDKFSISDKMKENLELLQQKIMNAAHESTAHVQLNIGDFDLWLKSFTQQLSDYLIFSEKDLSGVKHDDVDDFNLLEDVIKQELPKITLEICNLDIFNEKLDVKLRPEELLSDHLCQCCWVQCPFCGAICTNTIENHKEDHSVPFHRVGAIKGSHYYQTEDFSADFCTTSVTSTKRFLVSEVWFPFKNYRTAGGVYATWSITPDLSELPYWKWFVCRFQTDLEKYYKRKFQGHGEIPSEWRNHKKQHAIESLEKYF